MLTLTRRVGESILIGDNVEIVVKEIRRNQVRIGIIAPLDVQIIRSELKGDEGEEGDVPFSTPVVLGKASP
jgi:carbon storage regulator